MFNWRTHVTKTFDVTKLKSQPKTPEIQRLSFSLIKPFLLGQRNYHFYQYSENVSERKKQYIYKGRNESEILRNKQRKPNSSGKTLLQPSDANFCVSSVVRTSAFLTPKRLSTLHLQNIQS